MKVLEAKPIIQHKYWILCHNQNKIGQIQLQPGGYNIQIIGKQSLNIQTLDEIEGICKFIKIKHQKYKRSNDIYGYPTDVLPYNAMWSLHPKVPMYTKSSQSKSNYAAGWYLIQYNNQLYEVAEFCPKFINLQRNTFEGPFKTKPETIVEKRLKYLMIEKNHDSY